MWIYVETQRNNFCKDPQYSRAKGSQFRKSYYGKKNKTEHFFGTSQEFATEGSSGPGSIHTETE